MSSKKGGGAAVVGSGSTAGDQGVRQAVAMVISNRESLMLCKYGLNALSEFCTPPKLRYRENGLEVLRSEDGKGLEALSHLASKLTPGKFDEQIAAITRIVSAIFEGLNSYPDPDLLAVVSDPASGTPQLFAALAAPGLITDATSLTYLVGAAQAAAAHELFSAADAKKLAVEVVGVLKSDTLTDPQRDSVCQAIVKLGFLAAEDGDTFELLGAAGAAEHLANYVTRLNLKEKAQVEKAEGALKFLVRIHEDYVKDNAELSEKLLVLRNLTSVVEQSKSIKKFADVASKAVSSLFTDAEFTTALTEIADKNLSEQKRLDALNICSALAFDASYAQKIVEGGNVPALLNALKLTVKALESQPGPQRQTQIEGMTAILSLLRRIASGGPALAETLLSEGLLDTLEECLNAVDLSADFDVAAQLCAVLAIVCASESTALEAGERNLIAKVFALIDGNCMKENFSTGPLEFGAALSNFESLHQSLMDVSAFEICASALAYQQTNAVYQLSAFQCMYNLCANVDALEPLQKRNALAAIGGALAQACGDQQIAGRGLEVLSYLAAVDKADSVLDVPEIIDAVCLIMWAQPDDATIQSCGMEILEAISSAADLQRVSNQLSSAYSRAGTAPDAAMQATASAGVLSTVAKLSGGMDDKLFGGLIQGLKGLLSIAEGNQTPFASEPLRIALARANETPTQTIFRAGATCVKTIVKSSNEASIEAFVGPLATLTVNSTLAALANEPDKDGIAVELFRALADALSLDAVKQAATFAPVTQSLAKAVGIYAEHKNVSLTISEAVQALVKAGTTGGQGLGTNSWIEAGGSGLMTKFCKRNQFVAKNLVSGMRCIRFMISCAADKDALLKEFKGHGTLQILIAAVRAAGNNQEVRDESNLTLPMLMDDAEAEEMAKLLMKNLHDAAASDKDRANQITQALKQIGGQAASPLVTKALVRAGLAETMTGILENPKKLKKADMEPIRREIVVVTSMAAPIPANQAKLRETNLLEISAAALTEFSDKATLISALTASRYLLTDTPKDAQIMAAHNVVLRVCDQTLKYSSDPEVLEAAGKLLQQMAQFADTKKLLASKETKAFVKQTAERFVASTKKDERKGLLTLFSGLLMADNPEIADIILNQKGMMGAVHEALDYAGHTPLSVLAGLSASSKLRQNWDKETPDGDLNGLCDAVMRNIVGNADDPNVIATCIEAFNGLCVAGQDAAAKKILANANITAIINKYEAHPGVKKAMAKLSGKLPAVGGELSDAIVAAISAAEASDWANLQNRMSVILAYLRAPLSDAQTDLAQMPRLLQLLVPVIAANHQEVVPRGCGNYGVMVMKVLTSKFADIDQGALGHRMLCESGGHVGLLYVTSRAHELSKRSLSVRAACDTMTALALDWDVCRETFLEAHASQPLVTEILEDFASDAETTQSIVRLLEAIVTGPPSEFLNKVMEDSAWRTKALEILMGQRKMVQGDPVKFGSLVNTLLVLSDISTEEFEFSLEGIALMELAPIAFEVLQSSTPLDESVEEPLMRLVGKLLLTKDHRKEAYELMGHASRRIGGIDCTAGFVQRYFVNALKIIDDGFPEIVGEFKLDSCYGEAIDKYPQAIPDVMNVLLEHMRAGEEEKEYCLQVIEDKEVNKRLLNGYPIYQNPVALNSYLGMLDEALATETYMHKVAMQDETMQLLAAIENEAEVDEDTPPLLEKVRDHFKQVPDDVTGDVFDVTFDGGLFERVPAEIELQGAPAEDQFTLRKLYGELKAKVDNGENISPLRDPENAQLQSWFEFCWESMSAYVLHTQLTKRDFAGDEIRWGALCYELWLEDDYDICNTVLEWNVHDNILFNACLASQERDVQKDPDVVSHVSSALCAVGLGTHPGGKALATIENVQEICAQNISVALNDTQIWNKQEHLIPRIKLVEKTAVDRTVFVDPEIQKQLLACWDRVDDGTFDTVCLRQIFRSMRRALAPSHVELMLKEKVCARLINELMKDHDNQLLVDGFFLLGILAAYPKLKDAVYDANGVEESLKILRNHLDDPPNVGVVTNTLSALGNIVLDHRKNDNQFVKLEGHKTVVWILTNRGENFPEVNAASAVVANSSYKRDDVKAMYGTKDVGGPEALAYAIGCYDGSHSDAALRALVAIFKAIANLALYVPNVEPLVYGGLADAYYDLYMQWETLSDHCIAMSLLTLTNLTADFNPGVAERFSSVLKPLIAAGNSEARQDPTLIALILETIASLCALPSNATELLNAGGIEFCVKAVEDWGALSTEVLRAGCRAFANIPRDTDTCEQLIKSDIFSLLTNVMYGKYYSEEEEVSLYKQLEIVTGGFKALRNLMIAYPWPETFAAYTSASGTEAWLWFLEQSAANPDPHSALVNELFALGLGFSSLFVPEDFEGNVDNVSRPIRSFLLNDGGNGGGSGGGAKALYPRDTPLAAGTTFVETMGLDATSYPKALLHASVLLESECFKASKRTMLLGICLLYKLFSALPALDFALNDIVRPSGENGKLIGEVQKHFSITLDTWPDIPVEFYEVLLQIVFNFGYSFGSEKFAAHFDARGELFVALSKKSAKLPKAVAKQMSELLTLWKVVAAGGDAKAEFGPYVQYHLNTDEISQWREEAYANGVQDLPFKDLLRRGGRCAQLDKQGKTVDIFWRANQQLRTFQWRNATSKADEETGAGGPSNEKGERKRDKLKAFFGRGGDKGGHKDEAVKDHKATHGGGEAQGEAQVGKNVVKPAMDLGVLDFTQQMPVGRLRAVKGHETQFFKSHGGPVDKSMSLFGVGSEDSAAQQELSLIFSSKAERDEMHIIFSEWKAALLS